MGLYHSEGLSSSRGDYPGLGLEVPLLAFVAVHYYDDQNETGGPEKEGY